MTKIKIKISFGLSCGFMEFKLYVSSDSENEDRPSPIECNKRVRGVEEGCDEVVEGCDEVVEVLGQELRQKAIEIDIEEIDQDNSDLDLDSDDWEDVLPPTLDYSQPPSDSGFTIKINPVLQKKRHLHAIERRQKRIAIRNLGILSYTLHAFQRNKWINSPIVHKKIKKALPKVLLTRKRAFWKRIQTPNFISSNIDNKELIYLLKYAVKWFVLNYRLDCNGMRVLGYIPKGVTQFSDYYPTSKPINNLDSFASIASKMKHNRDTGAQLFTAILRVLGFLARLVFSLPCLPIQESGKQQPKLDHLKLQNNKDNDLLYPYYWTEVVNPLDDSELIIIENISSQTEDKKFFNLKRFPREGTIASVDEYFTDNFYPKVDQFNQMTMHYVLSFTEFNTVFESSARYMPDIAYRWFKTLDLRTVSGRSALLVKSVIRYLNQGYIKGINSQELKVLRRISLLNCSIPPSFAAMKRNPNVTTVSTLRYNEFIPDSAKPVGKVNTINNTNEFVYLKNCLIVGKSMQQWKLLGRSIRPEDIDFPIKSTKSQPPRTILKKRKFNLNLMNGDESLNTVKLYGYHQTCRYINHSLGPNGELPRNEYGNIEIFKPWMIPEACSWLKMAHIAEILKEHAQFEFVPVITGFNFTVRPGFAVPIKDGVLVLKENEIQAKRIWFTSTMSKHKKDKQNKDLQSLKIWKLMIKGLKITKRLDAYEWK